jgi:pectinesterase
MVTRRSFLSTASLLPLVPALPSSAAAPADLRVVVAADGTGDFPTVQRAVDHVLDRFPQPGGRVVLEVRPGVYQERVKIPQDRPRLTLLGHDAATTIIRSSMGAKDAGGTFFSPIVEVNGAAFEADNLTFENTFGTGSQAVAVSVHSDRSVFRKCRFIGMQDTLYAAWGRQYYRDCYIEGHVDFIFGNAAAVFDDCQIHSRGAGFLTAHSRTQPDEPTGYVFRRCKLTGDAGLAPTAKASAAEPPFPPRDSGRGVFLGRPWRSCARVVFLDCWMGDHIRPEGWDNWGKPENEKTAWFAELGSTGPGANPLARVAWARKMLIPETGAFAPETFLKGGDGWRPL